MLFFRAKYPCGSSNSQTAVICARQRGFLSTFDFTVMVIFGYISRRIPKSEPMHLHNHGPTAIMLFKSRLVKGHENRPESNFTELRNSSDGSCVEATWHPKRVNSIVSFTSLLNTVDKVIKIARIKICFLLIILRVILKYWKNFHQLQHISMYLSIIFIYITFISVTLVDQSSLVQRRRSVSVWFFDEFLKDKLESNG